MAAHGWERATVGVEGREQQRTDRQEPLLAARAGSFIEDQLSAEIDTDDPQSLVDDHVTIGHCAPIQDNRLPRHVEHNRFGAAVVVAIGIVFGGSADGGRALP
jgi:hypothetical protein